MMLLAASATPRPTDSAVPDVQEVVNQMNSNASAEDKTSFLLEYLMAQREPLLNFGKTLLIALIVFLEHPAKRHNKLMHTDLHMTAFHPAVQQL